jgi:MFS family permease
MRLAGLMKRNQAVVTVILMSLANLVSFFDRGFLTLVIDPIKESVGLSDVQMGVLVGPAFIFFYATVSLPIARLADSYNRKRIIVAGIVLWSLCTALFGIGENWETLLVARLGLGLGEAALFPAAVSMISDRIDASRLSRAISGVTAGGILGASLAAIGGGLLLYWLVPYGVLHLPVLGAMLPWQVSYLLIAIPGILTAIVIALCVEEPPRSAAPRTGTHNPTMGETLRYLGSHRTGTLWLICAFAFISIQSGTTAWKFTFYMRHFGLSATEIGSFMGINALLVGFPATVAGGWLADRLRANGRPDANVIIAIVATACVVPFDLAMPNVSSVYLSLAMQVPATAAIFVATGVAHPGVALVMPPRLRSQGVAIYMMIANLLGNGLTPVLAPLIANNLFADPDIGLRMTLTILPTFSMVSACLCLMMTRRAAMARVVALAGAQPRGEPTPAAIIPLVPAVAGQTDPA